MVDDERPTFDDLDRELLAKRRAAWDTHKGPRVGDFVYLLNGDLHRFTHDWGAEIQTGSGGSYYLTKDGHGSFSGSLEAAIPKSALRLQDGEIRNGRFWFFHHDYARAHNGVDVTLPCRVYRYQPATLA